ncbi:hypothetical protein B0H14DRAFT_3137953 [Mycena olivaceomarginata]|nr:hypothetical protein B0H14DRAFT_3137953 [Mycena olivaceomarginata]
MSAQILTALSTPTAKLLGYAIPVATAATWGLSINYQTFFSIPHKITTIVDENCLSESRILAALTNLSAQLKNDVTNLSAQSTALEKHVANKSELMVLQMNNLEKHVAYNSEQMKELKELVQEIQKR